MESLEVSPESAKPSSAAADAENPAAARYACSAPHSVETSPGVLGMCGSRRGHDEAAEAGFIGHADDPEATSTKASAGASGPEAAVLGRAVESLATEVAKALGGLAVERVDEPGDSDIASSDRSTQLLPGTGGTEDTTARLAQTCRERARRVVELSRAVRGTRSGAELRSRGDADRDGCWQAIDEEYAAIMNQMGSLMPMLNSASYGHQSSNS